ncbi:alpha/beta hydrolase family protein [Alteromonas gilva]|uniref:Alpha/beta fold hydrolase n=1 Tax=Alteromonas gilva TaxID=2987522 RepID=A0ABT5L505_9ALTE|nr:alpha/beta fold hydrolase [Alteromonas gilva]MDC8832126.1 alpha/beta fold hydrolase [Alteromonas gilva]
MQPAVPVTISCADKTALSALLYLPGESPVCAVMLAPATGIKQRFYSHFARYLAEQGIAVLTYDNRGIGDSPKHAQIMANATLQCWGQQDMPAVLAYLQNKFSPIPLHLIGHSAGGQLAGLMHNAEALSSIVTYGSSSGSLRNFAAPYKYKAHFYMNLFIPLTNLLCGQTQSHWLGMGEPLPKGVGAQWRRWCNGQGYAKTEFGSRIHQHFYDRLTQPALWITATDDEIVVPENVDDILSLYNNLRVTQQHISPGDYELAELGHMRFFSKHSQACWQSIVDWLLGHSFNKKCSTASH